MTVCQIKPSTNSNHSKSNSNSNYYFQNWEHHPHSHTLTSNRDAIASKSIHSKRLQTACTVVLDDQGLCVVIGVKYDHYSSNMFGSKIVRIPRTFIRQSSVPNAINQNLRPKISNYAYHNTMANQGVQGTVNHSFYIAPDPS